VSETAVTGRVVFHPLSIRPDGDSWVIGRVDTGEFAVMPPVARRVITLLSDGRTVTEAAQALRAETGTEFAVADFVTSLDEMGFVAALDGEARSAPEPARPTLPWLRPRHVRWTLHPVTAWLTLAVITAAAALMIAEPSLVPRYHALVWSRHSGLVIGVNAALAWTLVLLHESGHLVTGRAAGVPSRMSLSTRLQFLAAQTDVSGIWAAPRRVRWTVYLAGGAVNLLIGAGCVLAEPLATPGGLVRHLLALVALESVLFLPVELLIFMRTDVYFLVQDIAGCANLYADGSAYVRYLGQRALRRQPVPHDPSRALPPRERRAVRAYSAVLFTGTLASITAAIAITIPATVALIAHALGELVSGHPLVELDGLAAAIVIVGFQAVWARTWWRRHGGQVRGYKRSRARGNPGSELPEGGDLNAAQGG
jgi:putative peptide zinc metalloprotease protein